MQRLLLTAWMLINVWASTVYAVDRIALRDSILNAVTGAQIPQKKVNIMQFGAKGDSATNCYRAFVKAMRYAEKSGPVRIVIPEGVWLVSGPIRMVSGVTLEISKNARLMFIGQPKQYLPAVSTSWEGTLLWNYSPFIYGYGLHDVAIVGQGTIDGGTAAETFSVWSKCQGDDQELSREWNHRGEPLANRHMGAGHFLRPQLIQLYRCERVTLSSVFIYRSPFWCIHILQCNNVRLRGLRCQARLTNNDGIDIESTQGVLIEDVRFDNGDDNVAIKSGRDNDGWTMTGPSRDILIRLCRFKGLHGVVIGSEMSGGVENVIIENCTYAGYVKRGIFVKTNPDRGGYVRNLWVNSVRFGEVLDLFYVTSMYAGQGIGNTHFSTIENLHVDSLSVRNVTGTALVLQGTPQCPIRNVSFNHINVGQAARGVSFEFTEPVLMSNCFIGPKVEAPSVASASDQIFEKNDQ